MESQQPQKQLSMQWYAFLVTFWLFFKAGTFLLNAYTYFTGGQMITLTQRAVDLYASNPLLKFLDVSSGIACILLSVYSIYTRTMLAGFKKQAPSLVVSLYAMHAVVNGLYYAVLYFIIGASNTMKTVPIFVIGWLIVAYLNYIYFKKRKALFVN